MLRTQIIIALKLGRYKFLSQDIPILPKLRAITRHSAKSASLSRFRRAFLSLISHARDATEKSWCTPSLGRRLRSPNCSRGRSLSRVHAKRGSAACPPFFRFIAADWRGQDLARNASRHEPERWAPFLARVPPQKLGILDKAAKRAARDEERGEDEWRKCAISVERSKTQRTRLRRMNLRPGEVVVKAGQKVKQPCVTHKRTRYSVGQEVLREQQSESWPRGTERAESCPDIRTPGA